MSAILPALLPAGVSRKRFSRTEYYLLKGNDLLDRELRHELFNGDILVQVPQDEPHSFLAEGLFFRLIGIFGPDCMLAQIPVVLSDDTELEPDVAVMQDPVRPEIVFGEPPLAADIRLVVQVSVSTLSFDAGDRAARYAQSGIPECWVLDVMGRALIVHRDPTENSYATITTLSETEAVSPLSAPQAALNVVDLLS